MSEPSTYTPPSESDRSVEGREVEATAPPRCHAYALFSELVSSPHEIEPALLSEFHADSLDGLPYNLEVEGLVRQRIALNPEDLKREYSGLFEVGSDGPPVPVREDLFLGQPAGVREDIVRFYDFFNYQLDEQFAWAPDHLSVLLEFMHYLAYHEASSEDDALSFQLAQADFCERHLANWVTDLAEQVEGQNPDAFYFEVVAKLAEFVENDMNWQRDTIVENNGGN